MHPRGTIGCSESSDTATTEPELFEDIFETDDEGGSDEEFDDSSDEQTVWDDGSDEEFGDAASTTGTDTNSSGRPDVKISSEATNLGTARHERPTGQNKFVKALIDAAASYSEQLRVQVRSPKTLCEPKSNETTPSEPNDSREIFSDDSGGSDSEKENDFSSGRFDDAELLSDRPTFDSIVAQQIFYHPTSPWAGLKDCPIEDPVIVATLRAGAMCEAYIKEGRLDGRRITYISKMWRLSQKWEGFFSELALYEDPEFLRPLQGKVIPKIIGVYLAEGAISVAMELPSSAFWIEASDDMSDDLKRQCISAFDRIHKRGVLHSDAELRHMLVSSRGEVTIIDFQESRALKPITAIGMKAATEADLRLEKRKVRFKLNFEDSKRKEIEKVRRVTEREERKRERLEKLAKRSCASDRLQSYVNPEEESEPEDPDDVLNPVVDPQTWANSWVGEPFIPACYIVPGQDQVHVNSAIQEFVVEELDRQEKDQVKRVHEASKSNRTRERNLSSARKSPTPSPVLPTRITFKRGRDENDVGLSESPTKKRMLSPSDAGPSGRSSTPGLKPISPRLDAYSKDDRSQSAKPVAPITPGARLVPEIHVPFEGYTEPDGFILKNIYTPEEISRFRKVWIQQYNIKRSKEDGLPYPVAEMHNLVPNSRPRTGYRIDSRGRRKRLRPMKNRGALRRRQIDMEDPQRRVREALERKENYLRNRKEPGTGLSDDSDDEKDESINTASDDGVPEGGRILFWHELHEMEKAGRCSSVYSTPEPELAPSYRKPVAPSKGILRRHLTPSEKERNVALLEEYKRKYEADSDLETEKESDSQGPAKRTRTQASQPISRSASPVAFTSSIGFERYAGSSKTFSSATPKKSGIPSPFGLRRPSFLSSLSSRSSPLSVQPPPQSSIPSRIHHGEMTQSTSGTGEYDSSRSAASTRIRYGALSESEPESDGDQDPSSSEWPPPRKRQHRRSSASLESDVSPRFGTGITLDEINRIGSLGAFARKPVEETTRLRGSAEESDVKTDNRPWFSFNFRLPFSWKWSFSKT